MTAATEQEQVARKRPCGSRRKGTRIDCFRTRGHRGPHRNGRAEWTTAEEEKS